ncbi:MAG: DUF2798 domain-containing protein [Rhodobacteraceae bacterium]|nr:DUF2798 domain-containing protein [Paracoccaceae bacterium]
MLRSAANLYLMFDELPYLDRFEAAATAGFDTVEIICTYEIAAKDTQRVLLSNGLSLVLMNAPPPNYTGRDRRFVAVPGLEDCCQSDLRSTLRYAEIFRREFIHVMAGLAKDQATFDTFVANLTQIADRAPNQRFTIEPLNQKDQPGYFLSDYGFAVEILDAVNRPNLGLQYGCYHADLIHGDAMAVWADHGDPERQPRYASIVFGFLLSGTMSLIVSGVSTWRAIGFVPGFLSDWLSAWSLSWPVAFSIVLILAPTVRRIVAKICTDER